MFANGAPCTTSVNTYRSTADFVDEVRVVPGLLMQTATTTTNTGACGSGTTSVAYTYDAQRRLTAFSSGASTTTYTAWDTSGRPTTGSFPGTTITNVYNDTARTWTQTQVTGASTSTTTTTFDANGAQLTIVNVTGSTQSTTTFTNTATAQVCK
jgi:YD repeat-containing protein